MAAPMSFASSTILTQLTRWRGSPTNSPRPDPPAPTAGASDPRSPGPSESAYRRIRGYSRAQMMNMSMAIITIAQTG